jgi:hypothetical protein
MWKTLVYHLPSTNLVASAGFEKGGLPLDLHLFDVSNFDSIREIESFKSQFREKPTDVEDYTPNLELAFHTKRSLLVGLPGVKIAYQVIFVPLIELYPQEKPIILRKSRYSEKNFDDPARESKLTLLISSHHLVACITSLDFNGKIVLTFSREQKIIGSHVDTGEILFQFIVSQKDKEESISTCSKNRIRFSLLSESSLCFLISNARYLHAFDIEKGKSIYSRACEKLTKNHKDSSFFKLIRKLLF